MLLLQLLIALLLIPRLLHLVMMLELYLLIPLML
jgi:hypothetical protein